jgi:hypothetical protein
MAIFSFGMFGKKTSGNPGSEKTNFSPGRSKIDSSKEYPNRSCQIFFSKSFHVVLKRQVTKLHR